MTQINIVIIQCYVFSKPIAGEYNEPSKGNFDEFNSKSQFLLPKEYSVCVC